MTDLRDPVSCPLCHWGTFDLTDEPPDLPPEVLRQVVRDRGAEPERVLVLGMRATRMDAPRAGGERWHVPEIRP